MPTYYVMDPAAGTAATVAPHTSSPAQVVACRWLPEPDLAVYCGEFIRIGFQGGLNWYRCPFDAGFVAKQQLFAGRWVQQKQPQAVAAALLAFLGRLRA